MAIRWNSVEERTVICAYRRAAQAAPGATLQELTANAQSSLPNNRRRPWSPRLGKWLAASALLDLNVSVDSPDWFKRFADLLPPGLASLLNPESYELAAQVVAALIKSDVVHAALKEIVARAIWQAAQPLSATVQSELAIQRLLLVGVGGPQARQLRKKYATRLDITAWKPPIPRSELLSAISRADLVIVCGEPAAGVRRLLDAAGQTHAHQVADISDLRSILDGLAIGFACSAAHAITGIEH